MEMYKNLLYYDKEDFSKMSEYTSPPPQNEPIYLDECCVTGHLSTFEGGIFIDLISYETFSFPILEFHQERLRRNNCSRKHRYYLNIRKKKEFLLCSDSNSNSVLKCVTALPQDIEVYECGEQVNFSDKNRVGESSTSVRFDIQEPYYYVNEYALYDIEKDLFYDLKSIPKEVRDVCIEVLAHELQTGRETFFLWEPDIKVSKYAKNLIQLPDVRLENENLRCANCGATKNLWLNLSDGYIGCGRINYAYGGGCSNGEEGAALLHYHALDGMFPLVVKLGTITKDGKADVFSYAPDESDSVIDPYLIEHLHNLGIDVSKLEITEETTMELEIKQSKNLSMLTNNTSVVSSQSNSIRICGPGMVGLVNLGNSCYLNATLQTLFAIPEIAEKYMYRLYDLFLTIPYHEKAHDDLLLQFAKLCFMVLQGDYCEQKLKLFKNFQQQCIESKVSYECDQDGDDVNAVSINPSMFRNILKKKNTQFSDNKQHDIFEFFTYFINECMNEELLLFRRFLLLSDLIQDEANPEIVDYSQSNLPLVFLGNTNGYRCDPLTLPSVRFHYQSALRLKEESSLYNLFAFKLEQTILDGSNVKGVSNTENFVLSLDLPLSIKSCLSHMKEGQDNKENIPYLSTTILDCLADFGFPEEIDEYYCDKEKRKMSIQKRTKLDTYPPYLILHVKRFFVDSSWNAQKVLMPVVATNDLEIDFMKKDTNDNKREHEEINEPVKEERIDKRRKTVEDYMSENESVVSTLLDFGYDIEQIKECLEKVKYKTVNNCVSYMCGEPVELEAPEKDDANKNITNLRMEETESPLKKQSDVCVNQYNLNMLESMGYQIEGATIALLLNNNDISKSIEFMEQNPDITEDSLLYNKIIHSRQCKNGYGNYKKKAYVVHLGNSTECGHYISYVKDEDNQSYLFNDSVISTCEDEERTNDAYLLVFKRCDI